MERLVDSPVNVRMLEQADRCWRELTEEALRRGFYGRAVDLAGRIVHSQLDPKAHSHLIEQAVTVPLEGSKR